MPVHVLAVYMITVAKREMLVVIIDLIHLEQTQHNSFFNHDQSFLEFRNST